MSKIFKGIAKSTFYFLTPFLWIIGAAVGSVFALIVFICYAVYSLFLFFTGRTMLGDLEEDRRVRELKEQKALRKQMDASGAIPPVAPVPQPVPNPYVAPAPQNPYVAPAAPLPPSNNPYVSPVPNQNDEVKYEAPTINNEDQVTPNDIAYGVPNTNENEEEVEQYEIPF